MLQFILWFLFGAFVITSFIFVIWSRSLKKRAMRKVAAMDTTTVQDWPEDFLESKRHRMDTLADDTVDFILARNDLDLVNHLFASITRDSARLPDNAPIELKDYFAQSGHLPEWADLDLIRLGQQVYIRHGVWISLLLCYKSLPECYTCAKGAEVLHRTARLNNHHGSTNTYARRIAETAKFVMFAMSPGGLFSSGRGMIATQKTRLIHGVIRHYIQKNDWDATEYGEPINQEDLAGTLMSFSALILDGLPKIGIELEPVEKEAFTHCWNVIGHIIGLDEDLLPLNAADALKMGNTILAHQQAESPQGTALMEALLDFQDKKPNFLISPKINDAMFRLAMGNEMADLLHVPGIDQQTIEKLGRKIKRITGFMETMDKSLIFSMVIQFVSRIGLNFFLNRMGSSSIINFYLPESLTKDWRTLSLKFR